MFDYYLGWLTGGGGSAPHFEFLDTSTVPFAREWGMETALRDARRVVRAAHRGGREVILGGHSLGASLTAAYAAWDFNGRPGYKDLAGLVLIDGGLLGSFDAFDLAQAQQQIADLETSDPFLDLLGIGIPEAAGLFAEVGGIYARLEPTAPATATQNFPLLPDDFKPDVPVTNRALLGHAFDSDTSPPELGLLHVNAGGLAPSGDPRDWVDGGVTPVARLAQTFGQEPVNGTEWYFPKRLTIDTNGADRMKMNDVARFLGLRLMHTSRHRRADLRLPDRPHRRRRPARREGAGEAREDDQEAGPAGRRGGAAEPSRPADGGAEAQQVPPEPDRVPRRQALSALVRRR